MSLTNDTIIIGAIMQAVMLGFSYAAGELVRYRYNKDKCSPGDVGKYTEAIVGMTGTITAYMAGVIVICVVLEK